MHRHRFASALLPSLVVLLVGAASSPAAAGTTSLPVRLPRAAVPQITRPMPVAYDPVAMYEAQSTCDPSPKPGTVKLAALIKKTYGEGQAVGISRACTSGGTSEHKEGRALDWMTSVHSRQGLANAKAFLSWLLGPDQFGVPYGNATRLGVMYVGWNDRYWAAYASDRGWAELKGCFSTPGAGSDTTCHRNHIHISLNWDGASGRTSLWDGTVLSPYCPYPWTGAIVAEAGRAADAGRRMAGDRMTMAGSVRRMRSGRMSSTRFRSPCLHPIRPRPPRLRSPAECIHLAGTAVVGSSPR
jgi:hypothetical protein